MNITKKLKNTLILYMCVCFPFLSFFAQKEEVDLHSCSEGKFTQFFYPSGELSSQGCLTSGMAEGVWTSYFKNGSIKSEGSYEKNKLQGFWKFYFENNQLEKQINYRDHLKNGEEIVYSKEGKILNITSWKLDKKEGEERRFYETGELQHVTFFKNGVKDGKCRHHAKDGRIIAFKIYKNGVIFSTDRFNRFDKNGEKDGVWKEFYESLIVKEEGPWVGGKKHGVFRSYDKRGNLLEIKRYEYGELVVDEEMLDPTEVIKTHFPNGIIRTETVYKNGVKNGIFREYNSKGEIIDGGVFYNGFLNKKGILDKEGRKQGEWIIYYESLEIKARGFYKDDLREGAWVFYYETGEVEQKGYYKAGEYDDTWVWTFKNGDKKRFEQYKNGVEHGEFIEYDSLGNILLNGNYRNGLREGDWIYHVNDHKEEGFYTSGQKLGDWTHTFSDGTIIFKGEYSYDEPAGLHRVWSSTGELISSGRFKNGVEHGKWQFFNKKGVIEHTYKYKHGVLVKVDGRKVLKSE